MLRKIIKSTKGKPCSCASGKQCDGCKKKKVIKPQVYIEEPRRLTVPIVISRFRQKPVPTTQITKQKKTSGPKSTLCQWFRRRKALNELKDYQKREKKLESDRAHREREAEILKLYQENEIEKAKLERERQKREHEAEKERIKRETEVYEIFRRQAVSAASEPIVFRETKPKKIKVKKIKQKKEKKPKIKTKRAKHKAESVYVIKETKKKSKVKPESRHSSVKVKKRKVVNSLSNRFVNCCYKCCCQFYCWMTIIIVVGLVLILYL